MVSVTSKYSESHLKNRIICWSTRLIQQCTNAFLSFYISSDAPLDLKIKASMISDMFSLVGKCPFPQAQSLSRNPDQSLTTSPYVVKVHAWSYSQTTEQP